MASRFTIGQRVRVVRAGSWNGTPPAPQVLVCLGKSGVVKEINRDTIGVVTDRAYWDTGVLQFLPDELEVLDNTSGDSVE